MANNEQVRILNEKGVEAWNDWRKQNPETKPDLGGARLFGANLGMMKLRGPNLSGADFREANLRGVRLLGANLSEADFRGASLRRARLREADLSRANLSGANLGGADLRGVDLHEANLSGSYLTRTDLSSANLKAAEFANSHMEYTVITDVDLSVAKGLDTVKHRGPSALGVDTIYRSGGTVPEAFLRGAGVPEAFITYVRSIVISPVEYYSCLISYSTSDQKFADLLHSQMQSKGARVWLATEDLKIGDRFRAKIDEAIRLYDKLLLVLTKDSVKSPWVESEVEAAFEKERKQKRTVLFPIRLDDAVMEARPAWAAEIRRTRHIGDFRKWKDHYEFQKAFGRLMRDLKAGEKVAG